MFFPGRRRAIITAAHRMDRSLAIESLLPQVEKVPDRADEVPSVKLERAAAKGTPPPALAGEGTTLLLFYDAEVKANLCAVSRL